MNQELVFAVVALVLSVVSVAWSVVSGMKRSRASAVASCFALMAQAESMLKDVPSALKFHQITEAELEECGVSAEEFVYLLVNFTSAGVYYRMNEPDETLPFQRGSYRRTMLESSATRRAWPLLRKMINPEIGAYGRRIEATIDEIESTRS